MRRLLAIALILLPLTAYAQQPPAGYIGTQGSSPSNSAAVLSGPISGVSVNGKKNVKDPTYGALGVLDQVGGSGCVTDGTTANLTACGTIPANIAIGQHVVLPNAGAVGSMVAPTGLAVLFDSYKLNSQATSNPFVTNLCKTITNGPKSPYASGTLNSGCTTPWTVEVSACDINNSCSAFSTPVTTTSTGPAVASVLDSLQISFNKSTNAHSYVIALCAGSSCTPALTNVLPNMADGISGSAGATRTFYYMGRNWATDQVHGTTPWGAATGADLVTTVLAASDAAHTMTLAAIPTQAGTFPVSRDDGGAAGPIIAAATAVKGGGTVEVPPGNYPVSSLPITNLPGVKFTCGKAPQYGAGSSAAIFTYVGGIGGAVADLEWTYSNEFDDCQFRALSTPAYGIDLDNAIAQPGGSVAGKHLILKGVDFDFQTTGVGIALGLGGITSSNTDYDWVESSTFEGQAEAYALVAGGGQTYNVKFYNDTFGIGGNAADKGIWGALFGSIQEVGNGYGSIWANRFNTDNAAGGGNWTVTGGREESMIYGWLDISTNSGAPVPVSFTGFDWAAIQSDSGYVAHSPWGGMTFRHGSVCPGSSFQCRFGLGLATNAASNASIFENVAFNQFLTSVGGGSGYALIPGFTTTTEPPFTDNNGGTNDGATLPTHLPAFRMTGSFQGASTKIPDTNFFPPTNITVTSGTGTAQVYPPMVTTDAAAFGFQVHLAAYHETGAAKTYTYSPSIFNSANLNTAPIIVALPGTAQATCDNLTSTSSTLTFPTSGTLTGDCRIIQASSLAGTTLALSGAPTKINNETTVAPGVAPILYTADNVAQVAAITDTTMFTVGASSTDYRFSGSINCTTTSAAATATLTLKWTDTGSQAQSLTSVAACTALGSSSFNSLVEVIRAKNGTAITYGVTIANTPTYDVSATLEAMR